MGILVNESQIGGGASNSSHNIGDIFYTTRTDNSLNGAVECNGSQYNFSDFDSNLQSLFDDGKLPYITIDEFDAMVTNQGGCDSFGYKTPKMVKIYPAGAVTIEPWIYIELTDEQYNSIYDILSKCKTDDILPFRLYDINTTELLNGYYLKCTDGTMHQYSVFNNEDEETSFVWMDIADFYVNDPLIIPDPDKSQTDPTTYFKVPKKLGRVLVRSQKPTADNDYTWFNIYADGWVEQGGNATVANAGTSFTLPIEMSDANYTIVGGKHGSDTDSVGLNIQPSTTTRFVAGVAYGRALTRQFSWQVSGYAASTEYSKDKWNYQNIQVERCMVQLFNSTTDTAVATCNQVLADVSALNQGDYVIETKLPTEENNYSWYRLYKSGWVEQGGICPSLGYTVTFPVVMSDVNYTALGTARDTSGNYAIRIENMTTTGMKLNSSATNQHKIWWQVSGMSAQGSN